MAMDQVDLFKRASMSGAAWLVAHQRDDGSLPSVTQVIEAQYKGLWALHVSGHTDAASALADYVASVTIADGDIPEPREEPYFLDVHYLYAHGYLAIGAHLLGRFDLATRLMSFIRSRQDATLGGFSSHGPKRGGDGRCDSVSTGLCGLVSLYHGQPELARAAAGFLGTLWRGQPDRSTVFHATMTPDGHIGAPDGLAVRVREPDQDWYALGMPALFLSAYHAYSGDPDALALAVEILDFLDGSCHPDAFVDPSSGKAAVAASELYRQTGRPRYREIATGIAELLVSRQTSSGYWSNELGPGLTELPWSDVDMTAEYVLWLDLVQRNVSSGDRAAASARLP